MYKYAHIVDLATPLMVQSVVCVPIYNLKITSIYRDIEEMSIS